MPSLPLRVALARCAPLALAGCLDTHTGKPETPRGASHREPGPLLRTAGQDDGDTGGGTAARRR